MHGYRTNYSPLNLKFLIIYEIDLIEIIEDLKISIEKFYHQAANVY